MPKNSEAVPAAAPRRRRPPARPPARKRAGIGLLLASATALYPAVSGDWHRTAARFEHTSGRGPLHSHTAQGATSVHSPGHTPWNATFGSYVLCSAGGADVEIEDIRYSAPVGPQDVTFALRTVSAKDRASSPAVTPVGAALGRPPNLHSGPLPGRLADAGAGSRVTRSCADEDEEGAGFTELLFVLRVGESGGWIDRAWIDYRVHGRPYTLRLDWQMIACGADVPPVNGDETCAGAA